MEKQLRARAGLRWVGIALGATLAMACWPPEVTISGPPEPETTAVTRMASTPAANPERAPEAPVVVAPAPSVTPSAEPSMAPNTAPPDSGPCGLAGTQCCAPANACGANLRCDSASTLCVASAAEAEDEPLPLPAPTYGIRSSLGVELPQLGGVGGEPFSAICPTDQLLIGIRALADDNLWGFGLDCGRVELSPSGAGYELSVLPLSELPPLGGGVDPAPPEVEYACPPQMVVTAVAWTLWQPFVDMQQVVKHLQLTCSALSVGPDRQLHVGPATASLSAGAPGDSPASQACGEQGAVRGFTGRSGGAIDALSTSCVTLSVEAL